MHETHEAIDRHHWVGVMVNARLVASLAKDLRQAELEEAERVARGTT